MMPVREEIKVSNQWVFHSMLDIREDFREHWGGGLLRMVPTIVRNYCQGMKAPINQISEQSHCSMSSNSLSQNTDCCCLGAYIPTNATICISNLPFKITYLPSGSRILCNKADGILNSIL